MLRYAKITHSNGKVHYARWSEKEKAYVDDEYMRIEKNNQNEIHSERYFWDIGRSRQDVGVTIEELSQSEYQQIIRSKVEERYRRTIKHFEEELQQKRNEKDKVLASIDLF